jgi:hypothetical protein
MTISSGVGCGEAGLEAFGAELIAVSNPGNVNKYISTNSFVGFSTLPQPALSIPGNWVLFNHNYRCQCLHITNN